MSSAVLIPPFEVSVELANEVESALAAIDTDAYAYGNGKDASGPDSNQALPAPWLHNDAKLGASAAESVVALGELAERAEALERTKLLEQRARAIGAAAMKGGLEDDGSLEAKPQAPISLYERIHGAKNGSEEASSSVEMNAHIDLMERAMKAGFVTRVILDTTPDGKIIQHGQLLDDVTINTFNFYSDQQRVMRERATAEGANGVQQELCYQRGDLRGNYFVIMSRPDDRLSEKQLRSEGFFVDTMSVAVQVLHELPNGKLELISYFVAGKPNATATRQDAAMVAAVGDKLGQDWRGLDATQQLGRPVLVPKDLLDNGPVTLVEWMDQAAGGTFFGQDKPVVNYREYEDRCAEKQNTFGAMAKEIRRQLVANIESIASPQEAVYMLAQLSQDALVERACVDHSIDPRVFGMAEQDIYIARELFMRGADAEARAYIGRAKTRATSMSCPGGALNNMGGADSIDGGSGEDGSNAGDENGGSENEDGECDFISKECPICHAKDVHTTVTKTKKGRKLIVGSCGCMKIY